MGSFNNPAGFVGRYKPVLRLPANYARARKCPVSLTGRAITSVFVPPYNRGSSTQLGYFCRFATQSVDVVWPSRSRSLLPVIVSPLTAPLYFVVRFWPLNSRVIEKLILPSL